MFIEKIQLQNYRNYTFQTVEFFNGINFIQGKNVQGKTNLIEAIFYCCIGKSLRASREKEVIKFDSNTAKINLIFKKKYKKSQISIYFSRNTKKSIKINDISIKKISELMGEFNAVYFSPDELKLIKEKPEDRRRFMDIYNSQISKQYFYLLNRYDKVLANRNKLLKSSADKKSISETIEIWNTILADVGTRIILLRDKFIKELMPYAQKVHGFLTSGKENLKLEYTGMESLLRQLKEDKNEIDSSENMTRVDLIKNEELKKEDLKRERFNILKDCFLKALRENFEKDLNLKHTTFGPHRDDIKVSVNNVDIRAYGSQGQQRTAALSLKLAEFEIMFLETGEKPVLLLDDVLSELDIERRHRLLKFCAKTQTFITGTDIPENENFNVFEVKNGTIKLIKKQK